MSSFEPTIIIFGSTQTISRINIRLPVSTLFAFDIQSLENIVHRNVDLSQSSLQRYFILLLQSIDDNLFQSLENNHRIISIYHLYSHQDQIKNSFEQLTLDLTNDISRFLINQANKQIQLERLSLVKVYYQQVRVLKDWAMSLFKAQPSHILLISLNSTQDNMDSAQEQLQQICTKLGYSSTIIRQLNAYIPNKERDSSLLPYGKVLFENEDPCRVSELLKSVSSIRLYLYGNVLSELNNWSELLIGNEDEMLNDEDSWSAFIENEKLEDDVKWNFAFLFGKKWKISRVSPFHLHQLGDDPRFRSALRRSHLTYSQRQIEITAKIFDWYNKSIENGFIHIQPKLSESMERSIKGNEIEGKRQFYLTQRYSFRNVSTFNYKRSHSKEMNSISFIWFDQILNDCEQDFTELIEPYQWNFFNDRISCMSFIENELRKKHLIILIVSGSIGNDLFISGSTLIDQIYSIYIYCAQIDTHSQWANNYKQIKGIYNQSNKLKQQIKKDLDQINQSYQFNYSNQQIQLTTTNQNNVNENEMEPYFPIIVHNSSNPELFLSHQRTIDSLLCMPHTDQSKSEMFEEFRRIHQKDDKILNEINELEKIYHSNGAIQLYTQDSFVCRTINQILRLADVNQMFKCGHLLIDMYSHLKKSYEQIHSPFYYPPSETFYRGQMMTIQEFNSLKENQGNIISMKTFLSTTTSMQIALMYTGQYFDNPNLVSVVFIIERNSVLQTRPYANISSYSLFQDEEEVLFAIGSFFTIGNIRQMPNDNHIFTVNLKMTDRFDFRFKNQEN